MDVDAPHDDALAALLPHLRQLFDPQEGSGLSFDEMLKALSAAAHAAGLAELVAELRRWKKAHAELRRTHIGALQHQLAEEVAGESLGEPHRGFPGIPEMSPEQLIAIFMYGETLHRDAEKAAQVEAWDSDPLLGPLMRQEVRADAQAFVHFYGAFAGYVARWLRWPIPRSLAREKQPTPTGSVALRVLKRQRRVRTLRLERESRTLTFAWTRSPGAARRRTWICDECFSYVRRPNFGDGDGDDPPLRRRRRQLALCCERVRPSRWRAGRCLR